MQDRFREFVAVEAKCAMQSDHPDDAIRFLIEGRDAGHAGVLAILTDIIDGASRPLGALMAVRDDGFYVGMVSGGCVEAGIVGEALSALRERKDRQCRYGIGSPWFDIVLPCRGGIGLHLHVIREGTALARFLELRSAREPALLHYDAHNESLCTASGLTPTGWNRAIFTAAFRPDPQILLYGDGLESRFLIRLAEAAGLSVLKGDVTLVAQHAQDRETAIVLLHHDLDRELPILEESLKTKAFFIGCLGSRRTQERRLAALLKAGHSTASLERIHGPIGLFGPSREARSVAVSVLAELFSLIEARRADLQI